jgi:uncharacterized membrane protein
MVSASNPKRNQIMRRTFGVLSLIVGLLWTAAGAPIAFAYSGVLFLGGAVLVWRAARDTSEP